MLLREGFFDFNGEIPVNLSGGYMGIGAMSEATVLYQVLEVVKQLRGEAGNRQVKNAKVGIVQSWRGIPTSSGATLILGV
jgi:acetyl-CoA C-acetyltransferase